MPSNLENLVTIKTNLITKLAEISADPKPSYNIDGQSISWTDYYNSLFDQLTKINALIATEAPYELKSSMY